MSEPSEQSSPKTLRVAVGVDFRTMADQLHAAADSLHPESARGPAAIELPAVDKEKQAADLRDALNSGEQPDTILGYVFQAIGAAGGAAPFGPGTGTYRDDLATVVGDWAVAGIERIVAERAAAERESLGVRLTVLLGDGAGIDQVTDEALLDKVSALVRDPNGRV